MIEWSLNLYMTLHLRFITFFQNPKNVTFYVFLICCIRFLELCFNLKTSIRVKSSTSHCQCDISFNTWAETKLINNIDVIDYFAGDNDCVSRLQHSAAVNDIDDISMSPIFWGHKSYCFDFGKSDIISAHFIISIVIIIIIIIIPRSPKSKHLKA